MKKCADIINGYSIVQVQALYSSHTQCSEIFCFLFFLTAAIFVQTVIINTRLQEGKNEEKQKDVYYMLWCDLIWCVLYYVCNKGFW